MRLITWNPITKPATIFNEIDNWFNSVSSDSPSLFERTSSWRPLFEVLDTDKAYRLRAELPGMGKKDVTIQVVNDVLTISGERKFENNNSNDDNHYSEFSYGKFSRSFNLPEDVKESAINASMKDGVLALEIPRVKKIDPKVKNILIK